MRRRSSLVSTLFPIRRRTPCSEVLYLDEATERIHMDRCDEKEGSKAGTPSNVALRQSAVLTNDGQKRQGHHDKTVLGSTITASPHIPSNKQQTHSTVSSYYTKHIRRRLLVEIPSNTQQTHSTVSSHYTKLTRGNRPFFSSGYIPP